MSGQGSDIRQRIRAQYKVTAPASSIDDAVAKPPTSGKKPFSFGKLAIGIFAAVVVLPALVNVGDPQPSEAALKAQAEALGVRYESDWGNGFDVTADEMGDKWPFIHERATVYCKMTDYDRPMVTIEFNEGGLMFGLNGVALGQEKMQGVHELMRLDEYGAYVAPASDLIERAIKNCAN